MKYNHFTGTGLIKKIPPDDFGWASVSSPAGSIPVKGIFFIRREFAKDERRNTRCFPCQKFSGKSTALKDMEPLLPLSEIVLR